MEGRGQQHLDFGDDDASVSDPSLVSAAQDEPIVQEILVRRRVGRRRRSEQLPEHLERRTRRIEPNLPAGVPLEDCTPLGVDVVEILEFERGKLWVRRLEYAEVQIAFVGRLARGASRTADGRPNRLVEADSLRMTAEPVAHDPPLIASPRTNRRRCPPRPRAAICRRVGRWNPSRRPRR